MTSSSEPTRFGKIKEPLAKVAGSDEQKNAENAERAEELEQKKIFLKLKNKALKQKIKCDKQLHNFRQDSYSKLLGTIWAWLGFVAAVVLSAGFGWWQFQLSNPVLIALLTTSTAIVLGIFAIAAKWLFPKNDT